MANKQIHELPAAQALVPEDQLLVSQAEGNLTRRASFASLPVRVPLEGSHTRTIAGKLAETISVRDFGAVGDGVVDDSAAFQAALDRHTAVHVPPGTYRLDSEIQIKPRRRLFGAGRDATIIDARGVRAFTFQRNAAPFQVEPAASTDWNRSSLSAMTLRMTRGGVRVHGHEFRATDLAFFGGSAPSGIADADGWCLDLVDANECTLFFVQGGYGAATGQTLSANGIRFRSSVANVNYGDSMLAEISFKLGAANTCGVLLEGNHPGLINNVLMERVQVNAPAGANAPGAVQVPGTNPPIYTFGGTVGIYLKTVRRCQLNTVDVEVVDVAFKEEGTGLNTAPGTNTDILYLNCQAQNCPVSYDDNNDDGEGRTMRRAMIGTTEVFPLKTGIVSTDNTVQAGRGATLLPSDLWLCEPNRGKPALQLRALDQGVLCLAQDYQEAPDAIRDGHPKNSRPRRGLIIDAGANNATVIKAPRGVNTHTDRHIKIGNGADHPDGYLHRIELLDPLYLTPRSDSPVAATKPGMVAHFQSAAALPINSRWRGPGLYMLASWQGGFEWMPVGHVPGIETDREENGDASGNVTLSQFHIGRLVRVNHGQTRTVLIGEGIVSADYQLARIWIMRQGSGRVLFQETGTPPPTWVSTSGLGVLKEIPRQYQIVELWLRWNPSLNAGAGGTEIYATHDIMPDGEFQYGARYHWTTASPSTSAAPFNVPNTHVGKILRVSNAAATFISFSNSFCPPGIEGCWIKVMKAATGDVTIQAGNGMTARFPGGSTYLLSQQRKIVTVWVTSSTNSNEPNSLYIEE